MANTTIALRVAESVKETWEAEVEESQEYDSLSHLIRLSVNKEIHEEQGGSAPSGDEPSSPELQQGIERLNGKLDEIEAAVMEIQEETQAEAHYEIDQVVLELLPTAYEGIRNEIDQPTGPTPDEFAVTAQEIAGIIGGDRDNISGVCDRLSRETGYVQSVADDDTGISYYWVEE